MQDGGQPVDVPRVRTLPFRVSPLAEESLDSWLEALAVRLDVRWSELLAGVGVLSRPGHGASQQLARAAIAPRESQIRLIGHATGVDLRRVEAMTLAPWISGRVSRQRSASMRVPGSRFCPLCLDERGGRWRVWWRLRWAFVCLTHCCLLVDRCSGCGGLQRLAPRPPGDTPRVGRCTSYLHRSLTGARCSAELFDNTPTLVGHDDPLIATQRGILAVLRAGASSGGIYADEPVGSEVFAQDLRLLGTWILRFAHRDELWTRVSDVLGHTFSMEADARWLVSWPAAGQRVSRSGVAHDAVAACLALPILSAADPAAAAEKLRWLATSMDRRGLSLRTPGHRWGTGTSAALNAIAEHMGPAARVGDI
jgi:hypothetical protein